MKSVRHDHDCLPRFDAPDLVVAANIAAAYIRNQTTLRQAFVNEDV
jgi:hypothetical protein